MEKKTSIKIDTFIIFILKKIFDITDYDVAKNVCVVVCIPKVLRFALPSNINT